LTDRSILRRGFALLWLTIRTHPRPFAIAVAGATLFSVAAVGGTIVLGRVTDDVIIPAFEGGVPGRSLALAATAILAAAALRSLGVVLRRYWGAMTTRQMQVTWFDALADRYVREPLRFFLDRPAGRLLAHADADAERAAFAMQPLPFSLGVIVIIFFATVNLALVDLYLTALAVALFPALTLMNRAYTRRVEAPAAAAQAAVGSVSSVAHESFEGALVVKTLGLQESEQRRVEHEADALRTERLIVGRLRASFEPAIDALPTLGTLAVLAIGAWRVSDGAISTGDVVQAMALFGILAFPMRVVGFLLEELPRSVVAYDRLQEVLADPTSDAALTESDQAPTPATSLPAGVAVSLTVEGLRFGFGDDEVLRGVDFHVDSGEVVALVGSTGVGKTTICNLVARLVAPTGGSIALNDHPLDEIDPDDLRDRVAIVFQESFLFADTIRENVTMGRLVPPERLAAALDIAQATSVVDGLDQGLDQVVGERGVTLSGGQRQRIALARALVREPQVLVLDDATSAIDPTVEARILQGLGTELAATTLIVAHRLATIRLADRVLYLDEGRIAAAGTHDELLDHAGYEALVRAYEDGTV